MRRMTCSYLYHDGTLFNLYEEFRKGVQIGETVDVFYGYADEVLIFPDHDARYRFHATPQNTSGRIVFHRYYERGQINIMKGAKLEVILPSLNAGSESSKAKGIAVGYLNVDNPKLGKFSWQILDGLISSGVTLQSGDNYTVKDLVPGDFWYDREVRVNKVKYMGKKAKKANA